MSKVLHHYKTKIDRIENILERYQEARDNDSYLCGLYWYEEMTFDLGVDPSKTDATRFFRLLADGKLSQPDNITRLRRKVQEKRVDLRGANYGKRKKEQEQVQKNINTDL